MFFNLIAIIIYLTIYLKFIIGITFLPIIIIYYFFPKLKLYINVLKNIIWSSISFITHMLVFKNIYIDTNEFIDEIKSNTHKPNIIISNHLLDLDFLIHNIIFTNTPLNSTNNGLAKKIVGYQLPICGFFGILTGDIFLHRKAELDINKLNQKIYFNNLLLYPEGTCFTKEKKTISDNYCNKNKLIKFNYHLYPRITGLKTIIKANKNIKYIYDTTLVYDNISTNKYGKHYTIFSYLYNLHSFPNKIFIKTNKYKINDDNIEKQIEKIFYHKDKFIEKFDSNYNKFIPIKYNYFKGLGCFIITNLLTIISIWLFIRFAFIRYLYLVEFIMYYVYFFFFI
jgi:1-acyl-sn-glycerol-3-phosphate acyltransferase